MSQSCDVKPNRHTPRPRRAARAARTAQESQASVFLRNLKIPLRKLSDQIAERTGTRIHHSLLGRYELAVVKPKSETRDVLEVHPGIPTRWWNMSPFSSENQQGQATP